MQRSTISIVLIFKFIPLLMIKTFAIFNPAEIAKKEINSRLCSLNFNLIPRFSFHFHLEIRRKLNWKSTQNKFSSFNFRGFFVVFILGSAMSSGWMARRRFACFASYFIFPIPVAKQEKKSFHIKLMKSIESMQLRLYCRSIFEIGFPIKNAAMWEGNLQEQESLCLRNSSAYCAKTNEEGEVRCTGKDKLLHDKEVFPLHLYFLVLLYILQQFFPCCSSSTPSPLLYQLSWKLYNFLLTTQCNCIWLLPFFCSSHAR